MPTISFFYGIVIQMYWRDHTPPAVEPLRDPSFFKRVFISFGVPSWPNGFEVDAIALHMELEKSGLLIGSAAA